ncbi:MAG: hypothetical protein KF912_10050 [Phycisphaeraceae bacterium]|nr:hypothetical protein [Phycisphaeraceae bacterium]
MHIRLSSVVTSVAGLAIAVPALGQSIPWLNPVAGNWSDTTRWTGGNVPDASGESAVLGLTGAYTVTQNVAGLMLDAIDITNTDAVLNLGGRAVTLLGTGIANSGTIVNNTGTGTISGLISNGATGRINVNSGTALNIDTSLVNDGLFTVNTSGGSSTTTLTIQAPLTIGGSGSLVLNNTTNRAQVIASGSGALTNGASHTIRGFGQITAPMTNNGTVSATVAGQSLFLSLTDKTNNGLMRGAGGTLDIVSITITQGASGVIRGEETLATLSSSSISGGSIDSTGAGRIRTVAGTSVLSNVDSTADVEVASGTGLALSGGYTNDGTLLVNLSGGASTTSLRIDGTVTIDGTGTIRLNNTTTRGQIIAGTDGVLTLGAGQFVHGRGQISVGGTNNGIISADVAANELLLNIAAKENNGLMEAAGGILGIVGITVTQGASGEVLADGSEVQLNGATIVGGEIASIGAGRVRTVLGTNVFAGVDSTADVEVNSGTALALAGGSYTNDGSLTVNPQGGASTTSLRIDGPLTIDGTGEILLNSTTSRAQIIAGTDGNLTIGSGQFVHGLGQITVPMTNNGLVSADVAAQTLFLSGTNKTNNGMMESAGGTLAIVGITVTQGSTGDIVADESNVDLNTSAIIGGSIASTGAGRVRTVAGTNVFTGVSSTADVEVNSGTALALAGGSYTNDGSITVNPTGGASTTSLRIDGPLTIDGTGEILLNSTTSRAQIIAGVGGSLVLGPGQTVRGIGQMGMPLTLEGVAAPGVSAVGSLTVAPNTIVITWEPTSTLDVELGSAASFDKINGGSHTINGGTVKVSLVGGYTPALFATHTVIDGGAGSVVTGMFDSVTGPALPPPWVWKAGYSGTDVVVGVTCPSDVNADFIVDIVDFLDFLDAFGTCDGSPAPCAGSTGVSADYNGDTFVDILDFLDFFDAFGSGC